MRQYLTLLTLLLCLAPISEVEGRGLADPRLLGGLVIRSRYHQTLYFTILETAKVDPHHQGSEETGFDQLVSERT